ncbi:MAG: nicotinate-nucleotide adenylyltransferase [Planctomycetales bacterium]|nr:nicotinate-nucleotide adenylyltransferase [Planctomycetales bacterium]
MCDSTTVKRIGILGGSFDPIHLGHLLIAEIARDTLHLDQVRFMLAAISPLKQDRPPTSDQGRLEMLQLAVAGNPAFQVDDRELRRGGVSYTVDSLRELHVEIPDAELFFLMGADSLVEFHRWKEPEAICQLSKVIVLLRGGQPKPDIVLLERYLGHAATEPDELFLTLPQLEISSSDIRQRVESGRSIRYQVPACVEAYIQAHSLYSKSKQAK